MNSESNENEKGNDVESKQQHIKDRLKEMGVSPDSVRPEKSGLTKYVSYFIVLIVAVLVGGYWYENQKQDNPVDEVVVSEQNDVPEPVSNAYYTDQQDQSIPYTNYKNGNSTGSMPENQNNMNAWNGADRRQNSEADYNRYNANYQPQYTYNPQPYWPGYFGYYPSQQQMPPPGNSYQDRRQTNAARYQQPPRYNYPQSNQGQMYYYNGWQR